MPLRNRPDRPDLAELLIRSVGAGAETRKDGSIRHLLRYLFYSVFLTTPDRFPALTTLPLAMAALSSFSLCT